MVGICGIGGAVVGECYGVAVMRLGDDGGVVVGQLKGLGWWGGVGGGWVEGGGGGAEREGLRCKG